VTVRSHRGRCWPSFLAQPYTTAVLGSFRNRKEEGSNEGAGALTRVLFSRDRFTQCWQGKIRPECLVGQGPCLSPRLQERAQRFPVGDVDKEPADADTDLALAGS
jgi:hypothetical protein